MFSRKVVTFLSVILGAFFTLFAFFVLRYLDIPKAFEFAMLFGLVCTGLLFVYMLIVSRLALKKYLKLEAKYNISSLYVINGNIRFQNKQLNGKIYIIEKGVIIASIQNKPNIIEKLDLVNIKSFELVNNFIIKIIINDDRNYEIISNRSRELYDNLKGCGWLEKISN